MRSNQVYQPTTTSLPYDRTKTWIPSFLAQSDHGTSWSKILILIITVLFSVMGLIMIIIGAISFNNMTENVVEENTSVHIVNLCVGILFIIIAIAALVFYYRHLGYYVPCCPGKIARIRKYLQESRIVGKSQFGTSGQPVSAQYCPPAPPSVRSSPPIPYTDSSEQQRLMEDKQDLADDTDRILEEDPRIVLTPLKSHEEC